MEKNYVVISLIVLALFLISSMACVDTGGSGGSRSTSTPTPVADSTAGCYNRVYSECMNAGDADTCREFANLTCYGE